MAPVEEVVTVAVHVAEAAANLHTAVRGTGGPDVTASARYVERRSWIAEYFDRTAAHHWKALTSDAKVSRVRATVRAGRDRMRRTLLAALPVDLSGQRVLDAGCGTGVLAMDLARRGAQVTAIDLSPTLVAHARETAAASGVPGIDFQDGDMLAAGLGEFEWVVGMDSLIHYDVAEMVGALETLAPRVSRGIVFTVAPKTWLLSVMWTVGRLFPRHDRAPSIVPVDAADLERRVALSTALAGWRIVGKTKVEQGFYRSQAIVLLRDAARGSA
ncbi:MAG: magnesium protoporphyrin IX methyltransferase [Gemmatimonadaceae bacterium]|jgi:magnesium-protoporphyrin O-methyltransferase|nr:magnesium protoporphyrin IX methyltransferase [Gemmatimonadaceae bacterium]